MTSQHRKILSSPPNLSHFLASTAAVGLLHLWPTQEPTTLTYPWREH